MLFIKIFLSLAPDSVHFRSFWHVCHIFLLWVCIFLRYLSLFKAGECNLLISISRPGVTIQYCAPWPYSWSAVGCFIGKQLQGNWSTVIRNKPGLPPQVRTLENNGLVRQSVLLCSKRCCCCWVSS